MSATPEQVLFTAIKGYIDSKIDEASVKLSMKQQSSAVVEPKPPTSGQSVQESPIRQALKATEFLTNYDDLVKSGVYVCPPHRVDEYQGVPEGESIDDVHMKPINYCKGGLDVNAEGAEVVTVRLDGIDDADAKSVFGNTLTVDIQGDYCQHCDRGTIKPVEIRKLPGCADTAQFGSNPVTFENVCFAACRKLAERKALGKTNGSAVE